MSHLENLKELKNKCTLTNDCQPYQQQLAHEDAVIDIHTNEANTYLGLSGIFAALIALTIIFTAFVKPLKTMMSFVLPWLVIVIPIIIGLGAGFFAGFLVAFSACFKQSCSPLENYAMFLAPLLSLIVTIPLTIFLARRRRSMSKIILNIAPRVWIVVGSILLALIAAVVVLGYYDNTQDGHYRKQSIRASLNE